MSARWRGPALRCAFCPNPSVAGRLLGQLGVYFPFCASVECEEAAHEVVVAFNAWAEEADVKPWVESWDSECEQRLRAAVFDDGL